MKLYKLISETLNIAVHQIEKTVNLLEEGATIPFISRYRKEVTGNLDEVQIASIKDEFDRLTELEKRKATVIKTIDEQKKLSNELEKRILECWESNELEDIYLPYKPKRQTRAEIARKKGLEPLADLIFLQQNIDIKKKASTYLSKEIKNIDDALSGACDIVAERINEDEASRNLIRNSFRREAILSTKLVKGKEVEGDKYRDYFDISESLNKTTSHRYLAMRRAETEGFIKINIAPKEEDILLRLNKKYIKNESSSSTKYLVLAIKDAYKRLLKPSIETEFASAMKEFSDDEAIHVFVENLRQLLLAAPLGQKRVLAIDPGYRTGCKIVCLDAMGNLLHNETIYPHPPHNDKLKAGNKIVKLVSTYKIDAIAIGNGTASRETEGFITNLRYEKEVKVFVVSENGASIYSASKIARNEFPNYDVTVRGAVSIGRRLMDPLAELVKIDPKSIGVGQYQHDVDQNKLKKSLDQTVESCVNLVGINANTASKHLLTYISGLGPTLAQNIVEYRAEKGIFKSRKDLLKVPRMGEKAFEQCAGFLRIANAENPLDSSAVHPESYHIVEQMAKDLNISIKELIDNKDLKKSINLENYITETVGLPTLNDILKELDKPGLDPRKAIQTFEFDSSVKTINDLKEGMILPGIVTNVTNFGCFVDVGIKENGLVHISELAEKFISDPSEIVSLHQYVQVKVLSVDVERKRVQLSMKNIE